MNDRRWQFWIDVGGTFTDCLAKRSDGTIERSKALSSGVTKGAASAGSKDGAIVDPARRGDPPGFWRGYRLRLLDEAGAVSAESRVTAFDAMTGELRLDTPLAVKPSVGQPYELDGDEGAPLLLIRAVLGVSRDEPLPPVAVRLGTTRGTNALLTRRGARTAFITTRGFADVLAIGYQNRPKLFELSIRKPSPLYASTFEIDERIAADGAVLLEMDESQAREELARAHAAGIESLAICLLNSYQNSVHEERLEQLAREAGFEEVSRSSAVAPLIKIVARGDTTVVDAYLTPVLRRYVQRLRESLGAESSLHLMTSAGGLVEAGSFRGRDSILSGPAGGVVGFSRVAENAGFPRAIGFDMGGTSTDVSRFDGRFEREYETEKAGVRVVAPMMAIHTVAAGGGSICSFDGVKLTVGPDSAGADPGPACYGRGGPLAVTDLNFYLGRVRADHFPFPLDLAAVERRLREVNGAVQSATGQTYDPAELAAGFLRIANANMAAAIRSISIAKGYDPRDYVLVAFGGAAAQHACAVAEELGMRRILNHPDASVLSALGIGLADRSRHRAAGIYRDYSAESRDETERVFGELAGEARGELFADGASADRIVVLRSLDLRYRKTDAPLTIAEPSDGDWRAAFAAEHERLYGYVRDDAPLEIVAARVEATARGDDRLERSTRAESAERRAARVARRAPAYFGGRSYETPIHIRDELRYGDVVAGPAIVVERLSATVVEPGWRAEVLSQGELLLERTETTDSPIAHDASGDLSVPQDDACSATDVESCTASLDELTAPDPIRLEIFNNQFAAIAEQMGIALRNTSTSVNVKERFDFSCAIFDAAGGLVVNAPHIPVHLGAMSETVRCVIEDNRSMQPGDVFVTNDPFRGGSHLPDITVVTPVHGSDGELLFFTASRAHHAEIGGVSPGSMPPFSRTLAEEGVLLRNVRLFRAGRADWDDLRRRLSSGPHPSRAVDDNLADIGAQVAANRQGARDLLRLIDRHSLALVRAYMGHIQAAAERKLRSALGRLADGEYRFTDHLDDGAPITVTISLCGERATIDFTGTGPVLAGNLNANRAIVTAAVMYVLRCLIDEDIPLNQGVLAPIELVLPECLLNPPAHDDPSDCAAVVGGNVETSQRVVDVLLGALGLAAASQGTMNNLLFGDATFGYYETICGGGGATANADGADAVHTHMTNTRLTDPEVLERRFPVRIREFSIRRGSGGAGEHRGGDGVVRRLQFLRPLELSLVTQRRGPFAPYGQNGGQSGKVGVNALQRGAADSLAETLPGIAHLQVAAGDVLTIETPGGGGFGST